VNRKGAIIATVLLAATALVALLITAQNTPQVTAQEPTPTPFAVYLPLVMFTPYVDYKLTGLDYYYSQGYIDVGIEIQNTGNVPWSPPYEVDPAPEYSFPWLEYPPWLTFRITDRRGVTHIYTTTQIGCIQGLLPGETEGFAIGLLDEHGQPYFLWQGAPVTPVRSVELLDIDIERGEPKYICDY
jgi:hypothetical protein